MLLVKDVDFHTVEAQFHEAVFTHASTSPNQQLIASLDVARRQMELEGYGLVHNAIEVALAIRREVDRAPADLEIFPRPRRRRDGAGRVPRQRLHRLPRAGCRTGRLARRACSEDEFCLDPTRMTLVCGTAGFDGTQFKGLLAEKYNIQVNKTSRNSRAAAVEHQQHAQRRRASDPRAASRSARRSTSASRDGGEDERAAFEARVKSLMTDVPDLPNFCQLPRRFRQDAGKRHQRGRHPRGLLRRLRRGAAASTSG